MSESFVDITPAARAESLVYDQEKPIQLLHLMRFHKVAQYPEGHPAGARNLSGAEAYAVYLEECRSNFQDLGGVFLWVGVPHQQVVGPPGETWDVALLSRYPTAGALYALSQDESYKETLVHRTAALADARIMRFDPDATNAMADVARTFIR